MGREINGTGYWFFLRPFVPVPDMNTVPQMPVLFTLDQATSSGPHLCTGARVHPQPSRGVDCHSAFNFGAS